MQSFSKLFTHVEQDHKTVEKCCNEGTHSFRWVSGSVCLSHFSSEVGRRTHRLVIMCGFFSSVIARQHLQINLGQDQKSGVVVVPRGYCAEEGKGGERQLLREDTTVVMVLGTIDSSTLFARIIDPKECIEY